jgi:hypothetical protein
MVLFSSGVLFGSWDYLMRETWRGRLGRGGYVVRLYGQEFADEYDGARVQEHAEYEEECERHFRVSGVHRRVPLVVLCSVGWFGCFMGGWLRVLTHSSILFTILKYYLTYKGAGSFFGKEEKKSEASQKQKI